MNDHTMKYKTDYRCAYEYDKGGYQKSFHCSVWCCFASVSNCTTCMKVVETENLYLENSDDLINFPIKCIFVGNKYTRPT